MDIIGLIALPKSILFRKEVLGKSFVAAIGGTDVNIFFPEYPLESISENISMNKKFAPLLPPTIAKLWKDDNEPLDWGVPRDYPKGNSWVRLLAISINQSDDSNEVIASRVYDSIENWLEKFMQYCLLCTKQFSHKTVECQKGSSPLQLYSNRKYIPNNETIPLSVHIEPDENIASYQQTRAAIDFASSPYELRLEYQMLLSAYDAMYHGKNRQVILDACSAIELCLVDMIRRFCSSKEIPAILFLDKYRYLGDRFDLVRKIQPDVLKDVSRNHIIPLRNDLMHNNTISPSNADTVNLLKETEKILSNCYSTYY